MLKILSSVGSRTDHEANNFFSLSPMSLALSSLSFSLSLFLISIYPPCHSLSLSVALCNTLLLLIFLCHASSLSIIQFSHTPSTFVRTTHPFLLQQTHSIGQSHSLFYSYSHKHTFLLLIHTDRHA